MLDTTLVTPANDSRLLREKVYDQLRADMISCRLAPGTEIRENDLAQRFGVSKSPVRDALMRLEREGLVITLPRQGYRVAPVSLVDIQDMFHLRDALEQACMERIVRRASADQLGELNNQLGKLNELLGRESRGISELAQSQQELRSALKTIAQSQGSGSQLSDELRSEFRLLTRTIAAAMDHKRPAA